MAIKAKLEDMQIGDIIACRYKTGGFFSELGSCVMPELPLTGSASPDGLFYFRKVDTGLLIADRVVQHSVSWDTLNGLEIIQGKPLLMGNVALNKPCTASQQLYPASNAVDGNYSNPWVSAGYAETDQWLQIDLGTSEIIRAMNFTAVSVSNQNVKDYILYGSHLGDGSDLINITSGRFSQGANKELVSFKNVSPFRYYRLFCKNMWGTGGGVGIGIGELELGLDSVLIRSLTGGNSYLGTDGKSSLTDKGLGAFPPNNEWDKYIVKSDLNGAITAGDDKVWHTGNGVSGITFCQDTPVTGVLSWDGVPSPSSAYKEMRLQIDKRSHVVSNTAYPHVGFRPVLEYIEPRSKATTLFY